MTLRELLNLPPLNRARVVAGHSGIDRHVRWVHVVDIPEVVEWVRPGQFLLTTAYAWPAEDLQLRQLIRQLAQIGLAGVGIAIPRFVDRVPQPVLDEANRASLPVVEIPWDIPFAEITESVHRAIVSEQFEQLQRLERIHRTLTRAALDAPDLTSIVRTISELMGRPTCVIDVEGHPLAAWGYGPREDGEQTPSKGYLKGLKASGLLSTIVGSERPVYIAASPLNGRGAGLVSAIRVAGVLKGFLWVEHGSEPPDELDKRAVEHACTVVALHLAYQQQVHMVESRLRFSFLDSLLEGSWQPTPAAVERARIFGYDPQASYAACILVMLDEAIPLSGEAAFLRREQLAARVRRELERNSVPPLLTVSLNRVIFLLPDESLVETIWGGIGGPTLALAVGQAHPGPDGVRVSYMEAMKALALARGAGVCRYSALLLPRALEGDREAAQAFVRAVLGGLTQVRGSDVLVDTLRSLASCGFRITPAAKAMHVHPNTLRYRIRRIEQAIGSRLADPEVQFKVRLALEFLDVQNNISARSL